MAGEEVFWGVSTAYQALLWLLALWRTPRTPELVPEVYGVAAVVSSYVLAQADIPGLDSLALSCVVAVPCALLALAASLCLCCCPWWRLFTLCVVALLHGFLAAKGGRALETRDLALTAAEPGSDAASDWAWAGTSLAYTAWTLFWWYRRHRRTAGFALLATADDA